MGASTVVAQMIMFISIMGIATGLETVFKNNLDESESSMNIQWDIMSNNLKTDITISSVNYNNVTNITTLSVLNTGKTLLEIGYTDVYLDDLMIPRNDSNRTIEVVVSTDTANVGLWDPKELVEIKIMEENHASGSHSVAVSTQYGTKDKYTFSVA